MLRTLNLFVVLFRIIRPRRKEDSFPGSPLEILVIELWNIGDIVLTIPFLNRLRSIYPRARVTMLGRPYAREILAGTGLVDEFIDTDLAWPPPGLSYKPFAHAVAEFFRVRKYFRRKNFDMAFGCRMHIREHVLLALSGARRRVGYSFGYGDGLLTDPVTVTDSDRHKAEDWLGLLGLAKSPAEDVQAEQTGPLLHVSDEEKSWAEEFLALNTAGAGPVVGIHPGASMPEKRWKLQRFEEVAQRLAELNGIRLIVFVDPEGYGKALEKISGAAIARVDLRDLIALIAQCEVLVCNDSGPMHIAGALGVRTVAIFDHGIREWFAPLGSGHRILSKFAEPAEVTQSVLEAIYPNRNKPQMIS